MRNNLWIGSGISGMGEIPILGRPVKGLSALIIKSLFSVGEQGFVYDPNDLTTLYQDASGVDFKIHVGATVSSVDAFHLIREIGFGVGVTVWAWTDGVTPVYVNVSQG